MDNLLPMGLFAVAFLGTCLLHSTLALLTAYVVLVRTRWITHPETRVLAWKIALILPSLTALTVTLFELPHLGVRLPIAMEFARAQPRVGIGASVLPQHPARASVRGPASDTARSAARVPVGTDLLDRRSPVVEQRRTPNALQTSKSRHVRWMMMTVLLAWFAVATVRLVQVVVRLWQLRRLRRSASRVECPELLGTLACLRDEFHVHRPVALLSSTQVNGPMTAGVFRPYILLPVDLAWDDLDQRDALMAHELVHVAKWDAGWNLAIQVLGAVIPFQPCFGLANRQLRKEMDFVADWLATPSLPKRVGLARTLVQMGDRLTSKSSVISGPSALAAWMAAFHSTLGRRVEVLLGENAVDRPSNRLRRSAAVMYFFVALVAAVSVAPRAVPQNVNTYTGETSMMFSGNHFIRSQLLSLAVLTGITAPAVADESENKSAKREVTALEGTPVEIPTGLKGFNGMLVGRLASKDVEKGTFVVQVDAVSRVWRNSTAEDPKSIVGKTVEVSGVFGRFLDVLVVTRAGETLEFECKHDGERLVFPGELLRKVAAYDPSDYPELPEGFRGFRGALTATILKKDAETFELIIQAHEITDRWNGNSAENPKSIEGKPLMLAGFWNRKDEYHRLSVGDKIHVGMQHIGTRSDHLTVAEFVRKVDGEANRESSPHEGRANGHGFRGILVGRLAHKDIERGTLTITVDAVPRVWDNNELKNPKSLMGTQVTVEGVTGAMSDALVVTKTGETIEVAALFDGDRQLRVGEVLRKVTPVKPGDYPEIPEGFRGFRGFVTAKVVRTDPELMELIVEVTQINRTLGGNHAERPESMVGRRAMLGGFWDRQEAFHDLNVGDTIVCGVHHHQPVSDLLNVIESIEKTK